MKDDLPEPTPRQLRAFHRFLKLLPHGKDRTLVVIKAHLLISEQVRELVEQRVKNPTILSDAHLDCHQYICLAQSFFSPDFQPWLWTSLKKFNKVRNDIAHNIAPSGLQDRMDNFVETFPSGFHQLDDEVARFEMTLWSMFDSVAGLVERPTSIVLKLARENQE